MPGPNDGIEFAFVVRSLDWSGLRYCQRKTLHQYAQIFICFPLLLAQIFFVLNDLNYTEDIIEKCEVCEAFNTFGNVFIRKLSLFWYNYIVDEMLELRKPLWPYDKFGKEKGDRYRRQMEVALKAAKSLLYVTFFAAMQVAILPFFSDEVDLPQRCWIPGHNPIWRGVLYVSEMIFIMELIYMASMFDTIFFLICIETSIQLRLLQDAVTSIQIQLEEEDPTGENNKKIFAEFEYYTRYHLYVLKMYQKLNLLMGKFFVTQYMFTVLGICLQIFLINHERITFKQQIKCFLYIGSVSLQLIWAFIPPSLVEIEAEKLIDSVYEIQWYKARGTKFAKQVLFMLMKTQEPLRMSAMGLFDVTRAVGLQVFRIGFSIATLLRQTSN